jgi:hypothetical protein
MDEAQTRARFDWLVELGGAVAPGLAAGVAAFKLAPSFEFASAPAMTASAVAFFGLGLLAMRAVKPEPRQHELAVLGIEPIEMGEEPLLREDVASPCCCSRTSEEEPLLLEDVAGEEPLLLEFLAEEEPLLLDDPLAGPDPDSRVVKLFANPPMPTPGQLRERIDRHLAGGTMHVVHEFEGPAPDASDALYAALSELRRSLR